MRKAEQLLASLMGLFFCIPVALAAEPQLYDTGPSEDSSYIRFVNATEKPVSVVASKAKIQLSAKAEGRVSRFFTVKSGVKLSASINGRKPAVDVTGRAWEYVTVVILPEGKSMLVRETPDDFNAMRSSVALFNLDEKCATASMQGGAKNSSILENVKPFSVQRRLINPVKLTAGVTCQGQDAAAAVDLAQLQAGERYSVFLLKGGKASQAFFVRDAN